ncbi:alpha/beta hydrolase [Haploplasma axanthum]|uniref:Putative hydrolase n=1 Tax=Haploplasma axanthum TaxID=29552 RepID=A0A449BD98_HAPAX|nr:dienelactone hydrolase family protein [Haploplasma axanthum]VEU80416.1 putative hydrolase [Haploplasma axanthum]
MEHVFIDKKSKNVFILLHGTGGNEYDLVNVAEMIDKNTSILGIRGNVNEGGMNRFFKRFAPGIYDLESYKNETNHLVETIKELSNKYNFKLENVTVIGFSNGANIGLGMIQEFPSLINNYVLFSPDYINSDKGFSNLEGMNIFLSTSRNDTMVDFENIIKLLSKLKNENANLDIYYGLGHRIEHEALIDVKNWYTKILKK